MTTKQEVEVKKSNAIATATDMGAWGGGQVVTSNDVVIAKILPLNFMSEKVKSKLGEYGEFRDTLDNQKFGDLTKPFEFIPFYMEKKWLEFELTSNKAGAKKREFKRTVAVVDDPTKADYNDNWAYSEATVERDRVMEFYVLIPSEVAVEQALPYVLSFKRTSLKAGKKLARTMFVKNAVAGLVPAATVCMLSGTSVQNDDGEYVVQDVTPARMATDKEINAALFWLKKVRAGQTKVMEEEHDEVVTTKTVGAERF